jgi:hypothetical protein
MNRGTLCIILLSLCTLGIAGCGCNSELKLAITTAPTTLASGASTNVAATVTHDSKMGGVTWSCTPAGSCGSFNPTQTASGANSVYTAPTTAPTGGSVTIIATSVTKPSVSSSTNVTITGLVGQNFTFYATGEENNGTFHVYSIAGVVSIATDGSGTVLGGEQDYNDGNGITITADPITGGTLTMAGDGSGNATLSVNSASLGADGIEVFALAYANTSHAVIMQFDGTATSLGSLDLQSSTAQPTNTFSFVATGTDPSGAPTADGGVFTVVSGALTGTFDVNDGGHVTLNTAIPAGAMVSVPDSLGRGTVTGSGLSASFVYYVVGPECVRLIDVDTTDTAVGSAYGQGDNQGSFSNSSIGASIFSMANSLQLYAAAGQFTTDANSFSGVGDLNESVATGAAPLTAHSFNGQLTLATTGYGSMTFGEGAFGDVVAFGLYAIDPALNILDPNNKTSGGGGALLAEMDSNLVGIGAVLPQTDTATTSFSGAYAFGAQGDTIENADEFDFVGEATVDGTTGAFAGTGALGDPLGALTGSSVTSTTATFTATAAPDVAHAGRYTLNPFTVGTTGTDFTPVTLDVVAYQANGGQLFWVDVDNGTEFVGSLEQVGATSSALSRAKLKKHKP